MSVRVIALLMLVLATWAMGCTPTAAPTEPAAEVPADVDSLLDRSLIEPFLERVEEENVVAEGRDTNLNADVWQVTIAGETVLLYAFADEAGVQDALTRMSAMRMWSGDQFIVTYDGQSEALIGLMNELFG